MKIGIFGGTFAPAHNGHVEIVRRALVTLGLDRLIVMPNGLPPHKESVMTKEDRFNIARLAFEDIDQRVTVSDYEITKEGANYSYLTLQHFKETYPDDQLFFIIGGDSLRDLHLWKNPQKVVALATLAVAERGDSNNENYRQAVLQSFPEAKVVFLDFHPMPLSSTDIRISYRFGEDNSTVVPAKVEQYIKTQGIFAYSARQVKTLKTLLTEKRFSHTLSVVKAGVDFARTNGISEEKAFLACLLHDCAKNVPQERWQDYDFTNAEDLLPPILHSGLGVKVAQKDFGVTDEEILDAIRYHTTAKPQMSPLAKLVFVADKAEKTRKYDTTLYYSQALQSIDKAFKTVLYDMYLIALNKYGAQNVDKTTLSALKYYKLI